MKLVIGFAVVAIALIWALAPLPTSQEHGTYNSISHLAYCDSRIVCLHEIAHALDQRAGWVSQTTAFYKALELYLYVQMRQPEIEEMPFDILELTYRSGDQMLYIKAELYAYLFQWSDGKPDQMPDGLRPFYDWDLAHAWMAMLNAHQKLYWIH